MELINGIDRLPGKARNIFLALGNFDGVHRGHQEIIKAAINAAGKNKACSAVLIFDPHPLIALRPDQPLELLTDIADRAEIMAEMSLDYMIVQPFTSQFSSLSPEQFVRNILVEKLGVKGVFVGEDYSYGRLGAGSSETLAYWGKELGFDVEVSAMLQFEGKEVSSSIIRSLLLSGDVSDAAELLRYYFFRHGRVIRGYGIGKTMVYPTANIAANPRLLWPGRGVYLTAVGNLDGGLYYGVTNVGSRPTFAHHDTTVETHILDFNSTIYNREIRICFLEKLRDTRTFSSPQQLKEQIGLDIKKSRKLIKTFRQEKNGKGQPLQAGCSVLKSR